MDTLINFVNLNEKFVFRYSPQSWCNEFASFVSKSQVAARSFLVDQTLLWHPPRLLALPREYEKIFTVKKNYKNNSFSF